MLGACSLLLSSCIEGEEEIWVNPDASGRVRLEVTAPTLIFSRFGGVEQVIAEAKEGFSTSDNVTLTTIEAVPDGGRTTLKAALAFRDAREVGDLLKRFRDPAFPDEKSQEELVVGETELDIGIPDLSFTRSIDVRGLLPPEAQNPMTLRLLGDSQINYRMNLPTAVRTHNADQISPDRRSLEWNVPLQRLLAGPVEMEFTAPLPRLTFYFVLAGVLLLIILVASIFIWKRTKRPTQT